MEKKTDIMPHHEVLLRLDAMDLERGTPHNLAIVSHVNNAQVPRLPVTEGTS